MESPEAVPAIPAAVRKDLFGHPRGLTVLATSEMWERFSFYGMQALLILYMTKYLLLPEHARSVLGLSSFRRGMEAVTGPLSDLAFAAQTYGLYSGLIYGTPLIGAWLGDRVLGKTRTITLGCLAMSAGHLAMASEPLFLVALSLIIIGAGGVIGNMAAQVGALYAPEDHRRTRAFGIYLITLNIGALAAPLVIGTLGERAGWSYGFSAAGVGMIIGLVTYLSGRHHLPADVIASRANRADRARLNRADWRRIAAIFALLVPYTIYNAVLNQAYAVMYIWADTHVNRVVAGWEVPVTWIGVVDGLLTILGVIVASRIWVAQQKRGREPGDLVKTAIGYGLITAGYLWVAAIATLPMVPVLLWIGFYVLIDFGTGYVEPPMQALVSRDAPTQVSATMMAVLKASGMLGYFLLGWLGRFYEPLGPTGFWLLHAALIACAMLILLLGRGWLLHLLGRTEQVMDAG